MKKAKISELKDRLSYYLDLVKEGGHILVMDRNTPVAEIIPLRLGESLSFDVEETYLLSLVRQGIARAGTGQLPHDFSPPKGKKTGVLETLLKERREGR